MPATFDLSSVPVSRRRLLALPAAAAAAAAASPLLPADPASASSDRPRHLVDPALEKPVARAYRYLDVVQDAYVKGAEPRLLQSYNNESGLMTAAFVYDNALAVLAYLANPTVANVRRARLIGDAFLWIQANDEAFSDGRVRQAYAAGPMQFYGGSPAFPGLKREDGKAAFLWPFGFGGSSTGDMAWTGTLGGVPGEDPNLINTGNIPEDVQTWAVLGMNDPRYDISVDWVIEHLWNTDSGTTTSQLPPEVQISGVTYSSQAKALTGPVSGSDLPNHRNAVWLEGNGHAALALLRRKEKGDRAIAKRLLAETVVAQTRVGAGQTVGLTADPDGGKLSDPGAGGTWTGTPLPARSGVVAASSAFDTGFAFGYFQRQHVGATSWFLMAAQNFNPYR
jgi:hypothetical protein